MGIEPRHDLRYVAESIGYSCQLPSKTAHNRVTDAKNPCQNSSNTYRGDETRNRTGRPRPKVGKRLFRFAGPRISRYGFPQADRRIVSDPTTRKFARSVLYKRVRSDPERRTILVIRRLDDLLLPKSGRPSRQSVHDEA